GVNVMTTPEVFLQYTDGLIDDQYTITNEGTRKLLQGWLDGYVAWVATLASRSQPAQASVRLPKGAGHFYMPCHASGHGRPRPGAALRETAARWRVIRRLPGACRSSSRPANVRSFRP